MTRTEVKSPIELVRLPRPEFARQPEMLISDLFWRSPGSTLHQNKYEKCLAKLGLSDGENREGMRYLLAYVDNAGSRSHLYVGDKGTVPAVLGSAGLSTLFSDPESGSEASAAIFESLVSPRASNAKLGDSLAVVAPDIVAFQNVRGFTNKRQPPNYADVLEKIGTLGGSPAPGSVAAEALRAFSADRAPLDHNLTGVLETALPRLAAVAWREYERRHGVCDATEWGNWEGLAAAQLEEIEPAAASPFRSGTPFSWFWEKWKILHDANAGWRNKLPARRYSDWEACLIRSSVTMGFLWEARFLGLVGEAIVARSAGLDFDLVIQTLEQSSGNGRVPLVLGRLHDPRLSPAQKACWHWVKETINRGRAVFRAIEAASEDEEVGNQDPIEPMAPEEGVGEYVERWVKALSVSQAKGIAGKLEVASSDKNLTEFVRNLLKPIEDRRDDTGHGDRADLYYLLATGGSNQSWFELGPEWLVATVSLLATPSGGETTLRAVRSDLASLGFTCDREVLVGLLERCGLTTDSPDADDGLIVQSAF